MKIEKVVLLFLSFILAAYTVSGQPTCNDRLDQARRFYEQGQLNEVVRSLQPCAVKETVSRPVRREILSLLQETFLFLDDQEMADSIHLELLRLDPFFEHNTTIPEVRYLVNQYETYPVATYGIRLGIYVFSRPIVGAQFQAFSGLDIQELNYKRRSDDLYGWTANADVSFNLLKSRVEIATGIGISNIYLRRNYELGNARIPGGEQAPASLSFLERQRWTQLPFLLKINGVSRSAIIKSRFIPYFCIGGTSEFLIKRFSQAIGPEIDFPGDANDQSASVIAIGDQRKRLNFAFVAGLGGKFRFKRSFISVDLRYHRLLQNISSDSNRFTNEELLETFNYVDDDFRFHNLNISAGVGIFLFRSKRR